MNANTSSAHSSHNQGAGARTEGPSFNGKQEYRVPEWRINDLLDPTNEEELNALLKYMTPAELSEVDYLLNDGREDPLWRPFAGPQTFALLTEADELFYGGAAGGGKTDLLLGTAIEDHWQAIIFRREFAQLKGIKQRGDELLQGKARFNSQQQSWRFLAPNLRGKVVELGACQNVGDEQKYQGRPHDLKGFDEITHFTEAQFRFLKGWNRSTHINPYTGDYYRTRVIAAGNPPVHAEGQWVNRYWAAWLDPLFANPAKPGEIRWYITNEKGEDEEVADNTPIWLTLNGVYQQVEPISRTFIRAKVQDNPALMASGYLATLQALPEPLRSRMLSGDFNVIEDDDEWQVIPTAWILAAQARWAPTYGEYLHKQIERIQSEHTKRLNSLNPNTDLDQDTASDEGELSDRTRVNKDDTQHAQHNTVSGSNQSGESVRAGEGDRQRQTAPSHFGAVEQQFRDAGIPVSDSRGGAVPLQRVGSAGQNARVSELEGNISGNKTSEDLDPSVRPLSGSLGSPVDRDAANLASGPRREHDNGPPLSRKQGAGNSSNQSSQPEPEQQQQGIQPLPMPSFDGKRGLGVDVSSLLTPVQRRLNSSALDMVRGDKYDLPGSRDIGVDVSRGGKHFTIISERRGAWFARLRGVPGSQTPDGPSIVKLLKDAGFEDWRCKIDVVGVGSSPVDVGRLMDMDIVAMNGAETSHATDRSGMLTFTNQRSEWMWMLREALDPVLGLDLALPPDPELAADLAAPRWSSTVRGIQVEEKRKTRERIGRSPDKGDAVMFAFAQPNLIGAGFMQYYREQSDTIKAAIAFRERPAVLDKDGSGAIDEGNPLERAISEAAQLQAILPSEWTQVLKR
jgi:hypothetical protein